MRLSKERIEQIKERYSERHEASLPNPAPELLDAIADIEAMRDALDRSKRLLELCHFDAPEDLADLEVVNNA